MKRREFIKSLAAAQIGMLATQMSLPKGGDSSLAQGSKSSGAQNISADGTTQRLNVFVHGAMIIQVDVKYTKKVYLRVPQINTHYYRAQAFTPDPQDPQNLLKNAWSQDYDVSATTTDKVCFDRGGTPNLHHIGIGDGSRMVVDVTNLKINPSFWTVQLPLPDDIWPLRATPYNYFDDRGSAIDTYHQNDMFRDQQCPIIYVLTYTQLAKGATVTFTGNNQAVPIINGVGRLHFYSDPIPDDCKPYSPAHLQAAITAMDNVFKDPLDLRLAQGAEADTAQGFDDSSVLSMYPSVIPCEEFSLQERQCYKCSGFQRLPKITQQYAEARKFLKHLKDLEKKGEKRRAIEKFRQAFKRFKPGAPPPLKPPSNCMSIIALQV